MTDIVCFGEALVEFTMADSPKQQRAYLQGFGGDTSNCAVAAARQGAQVSYVSALGADRFGKLLRSLWDQEGIDHSCVLADPDHPTGVYFVIPDPAGRDFQYYRKHSAAAMYQAQNLPAALIKQAKVLHLSAISQAISPAASAAATTAMDIAQEAGTLVSYDTNLRLNLWPLDQASLAVTASVARCDIALPSLDDSVALTGLSDPAQVVDSYHDLGAGIVALKMGDQGALVSDGTRREHIAAYAVQAVDATGAGDAFDGAFLAGFLAGNCPFAAARQAAVVAALTTTGMGAVVPIPHARYVAEILRSNA